MRRPGWVGGVPHPCICADDVKRDGTASLGGGGDQGGGFEQGGGFYASGEAGDSEDGNVVFLAEGYGVVGGLLGVRLCGEELVEAVEAVEFAGGVAGFEEA